MQTITFEEVLEQIVTRNPRYDREAYLFVRDALEYTRRTLGRINKTKEPAKEPSEGKHISGQELLEGIRQFALEKYGPMAMTVFDAWGIHTCQDFGELVFLMVEFKLMKKTNSDSKGDFENGYDFYDAFRKPFLPQAKLAAELEELRATKA
jgi:uncharacterized repeat protein (TIGR04138 family)